VAYFIGTLVKIMRRITVGFVSPIIGADRVAWQIVHHRQQFVNTSLEANIPSPAAGGTSYMDAPIGYDRTTLFNTIVTLRTPVGRVYPHTVDNQRFHTCSHTSRDYHPARQEYKKAWPVFMRHQLVDNSCVTAKARKISDFNNFLLPSLGTSLAINFKNYSVFADRMYLSEHTRNEQMNKQVRRFSGNTRIQVFHSSMPD